jgi:hypothetical protein
MPPTHVHFNGSVNLADTETVMREIASRVPSGLRRIPDGETGDRGNWIFFQMQKFLQSPSLTVPRTRTTIRRGVRDAAGAARRRGRTGGHDMAGPGYADAYLESYATFAALRRQGVIPDGVRFQVQYPTPLASISALHRRRAAAGAAGLLRANDVRRPGPAAAGGPA